MTETQKSFAIFTAFLIFFVIIYLVKKGKLREEFSWIWLLTGFILLILVFWYDVLVILTKIIGAVLPTTTLFIFSIIFLISLSLHLAIKVSLLTHQVKNLAQKLSILEVQQKDLEK